VGSDYEYLNGGWHRQYQQETVDGTNAQHAHAGGWHQRTLVDGTCTDRILSLNQARACVAGIRFFSHCDCGRIRSGRLLPDYLFPEVQIAGAGES
ncbi:MAG: hypothetical protein ACPGXX_20305, partial [Planctomycetaceae bacterium]